MLCGLEFLLGLNPFIGTVAVITKLLYRGQYAIINPNSKDVSLFGPNGVLYYLIGMVVCMIVSPILVIRNETVSIRAENDGNLERISRDPNL